MHVSECQTPWGQGPHPSTMAHWKGLGERHLAALYPGRGDTALYPEEIPATVWKRWADVVLGPRDDRAPAGRLRRSSDARLGVPNSWGRAHTPQPWLIGKALGRGTCRTLPRGDTCHGLETVGRCSFGTARRPRAGRKWCIAGCPVLGVPNSWGRAHTPQPWLIGKEVTGGEERLPHCTPRTVDTGHGLETVGPMYVGGDRAGRVGGGRGGGRGKVRRSSACQILGCTPQPWLSGKWRKGAALWVLGLLQSLYIKSVGGEARPVGEAVVGCTSSEAKLLGFRPHPSTGGSGKALGRGTCRTLPRGRYLPRFGNGGRWNGRLSGRARLVQGEQVVTARGGKGCTFPVLSWGFCNRYI